MGPLGCPCPRVEETQVFSAGGGAGGTEANTASPTGPRCREAVDVIRGPSQPIPLHSDLPRQACPPSPASQLMA